MWQKVAEIGEIPFSEAEKHVELSLAEHAIYLELEHHLSSLNMRGSRFRCKQSSDRELRLKAMLDGSQDAEEALLRRCLAGVGSCDQLRRSSM